MRLHIISLCITSLLTCSLSAQNSWKSEVWSYNVRNVGPSIEKTLDLGPFKGIQNHTSAKVNVTAGDQTPARLQGDASALEELEIYVEREVLIIKWQKNRDFRPRSQVTIDLQMPGLDEVTLSGSGSIVTRGAFAHNESARAQLTGSGRIEWELQTGSLAVKSTGSGSMRLNGKSQSSDLLLTGSGGIDASALTTATCTAKVTGSGSIKVNPKDELIAVITGSGSIRYVEDIPRINSRVTGSGRVKRL